MFSFISTHIHHFLLCSFPIAACKYYHRLSGSNHTTVLPSSSVARIPARFSRGCPRGTQASAFREALGESASWPVPPPHLLPQQGCLPLGPSIQLPLCHLSTQLRDVLPLKGSCDQSGPPGSPLGSLPSQVWKLSHSCRVPLPDEATCSQVPGAMAGVSSGQGRHCACHTCLLYLGLNVLSFF